MLDVLLAAATLLGSAAVVLDPGPTRLDRTPTRLGSAAALPGRPAAVPGPPAALPGRPTAPSDVRAAVVVPKPAPAPTPYNGRLRQLDVRIPKIASPIAIDGVLDDAGWRGAALLTGFSQWSPVDGLPAADSTEVLVVYSEQAIYFGIRAYEPHGEVIATLADRDRIGGDDHIAILLDTFNDRRRALIISVNPFGVQSDGTLADGSSPDLNPDFVFESKGRLTDYGYEVEVRIPFKSIPFRRAAVQDWGLNVMRIVRHSGHEQTWSPLDRGHPSMLAQSGTLRDLTGLKRGLVVDLNPVMTARTTGARAAGGAGAWRYSGETPEVGGNARWGVTPNLSLSATINPDFSQVEADAGQVIYDPRQAVAFPEKRPFFLEGSENFQVPNSLIYTRRIVSPEAAAKLSGKIGGLNVGVLSAVEDASVVPGRDDRPVYNLMRLRRDLGAQSNLGVVYTDRVHGSDYNRVIGADTRLMLTSRYVFTGQVATSFTAVDGTTSHFKPLFDFRLTRPGREAGFSALVEGRHPGFEAGSGFIARPGIARANFTPRRTFFPESGAFESISVSPILDGTWEWDRFVVGAEPNDIKVNSSTTAVLRGGWRVNVFTWAESFKYSPSQYAAYRVERRGAGGEVADTVPYAGTDRLVNYGVMLYGSTPQWRHLAGSFRILTGQDVNYDEWSSAWIAFVELNADWKPTEQVRVNGRYLDQRFHRKTDGSLVRQRLVPRLKLEYQVSRPVFVRFVGQYDALRVDALRDDSRTGDPILIRRPDGTFRSADPRRRDGFRADWLFAFQPNPGTVVFAGYGTNLDGEDFLRPSELVRTSDGFFLKVSYLFRL